MRKSQIFWAIVLTILGVWLNYELYQIVDEPETGKGILLYGVALVFDTIFFCVSFVFFMQNIEKFNEWLDKL